MFFSLCLILYKKFLSSFSYCVHCTGRKKTFQRCTRGALSYIRKIISTILLSHRIMHTEHLQGHLFFLPVALMKKDTRLERPESRTNY
jgi:hypothetical protein